jgi:hypothetical protein
MVIELKQTRSLATPASSLSPANLRDLGVIDYPPMTAHAPVRPDQIMRPRLMVRVHDRDLLVACHPGAFDGSSYRWGLVGLSGKGSAETTGFRWLASLPR